MRQRFLLAYGVALGLGAWACGTKVTVKQGPEGTGSTATSVSATTGAGGTTTTSVSISSTASQGGSGASCMPEIFDAEHPAQPIDAIVVANNGFDMSGPLYALELNLYASFVVPLVQAGVDVQTIVISNHGPNAEELCIGPPLSNAMGCNGPPGDVPGQFHQYSANLQWGEPLCKVLSTVQGQEVDEFGVQGWLQWLRQGALKAFLMVTNDGVFCTHNNVQYYDSNTVSGGQGVATQWDTALLASSPTQFGTSAARNYIVESLVGIVPKPGDAAYEPGEQVTTAACGFSQPGTGYQWLSKGTDALRLSSCSTGNYTNILLSAASDVLSAATDRCTVFLPQTPTPGQELILEYLPSGGGVLQFTEVASPAQCGQWNFYVDGDQMHLCPGTCDYVNGDPNGSTQVVYECPIKG